MNLSDWAKEVGVTKSTAYRWFREGKLPVKAVRVGRLILVEKPEKDRYQEKIIIYCRVSSNEQKEDLERQVGRVSSWAAREGYFISEIVTEVGSGMNGARPKFLKILLDPSITVILSEHRDRLGRFGLEYIEACLTAQRRKIIIMNKDELSDDLVRDMTEILTSFCARLYGKRGAANRARRALEKMQSE